MPYMEDEILGGMGRGGGYILPLQSHVYKKNSTYSLGLRPEMAPFKGPSADFPKNVPKRIFRQNSQ